MVSKTGHDEKRLFGRRNNMVLSSKQASQYEQPSEFFWESPNLTSLSSAFISNCKLKTFDFWAQVSSNQFYMFVFLCIVFKSAGEDLFGGGRQKNWKTLTHFKFKIQSDKKNWYSHRALINKLFVRLFKAAGEDLVAADNYLYDMKYMI